MHALVHNVHIGAHMLECNQGFEYLYICECRVGCLHWDRGVGGAEQVETGAGQDGEERESPSGVSGL